MGTSSGKFEKWNCKKVEHFLSGTKQVEVEIFNEVKTFGVIVWLSKESETSFALFWCNREMQTGSQLVDYPKRSPYLHTIIVVSFFAFSRGVALATFSFLLTRRNLVYYGV